MIRITPAGKALVACGDADDEQFIQFASDAQAHHGTTVWDGSEELIEAVEFDVNTPEKRADVAAFLGVDIPDDVRWLQVWPCWAPTPQTA